MNSLLLIGAALVIKAQDPAAPTTQTKPQTEEQKQKAKEAVETKAPPCLSRSSQES